MKIYVSGGAKNGKSTYTQNKAVELSKKDNLPLYYVATMIARDDEDVERVLRHRRERRGLGFKTIEVGPEVGWILDEFSDISEKGVYLIDSITALLANAMFPNDMLRGFNENAAEDVIQDLTGFINRVEHVIMVSDYLYAERKVSKYEGDDWTYVYMEGLAKIDRTIGALCDEVVEVSAGIAENLLEKEGETESGI